MTTTIRSATKILLQRIALPVFRPAALLDSKRVSPVPTFIGGRSISYGVARCAAAQSGNAGRKASSRLSQVQQFLLESEERSNAAASESPPPKLRLEHVSVSFAQSGGPGGQNVNKVNTKVDMRFNVKKATWLSDRMRDKILLMVKNRINKAGEIVVSSSKTRSQLENIQDCLKKLQVFLDAASYVPPPPSEEHKKKIVELAAMSEQKRLESKKGLSQKKQLRTKSSWV
ncbi:putative uncharacterized protein YOL114C [Silene latifolia]|uniref:putative uncharacterized protein YOL114C n=1 Tax=Silene latifolia TaxID=37657 RepID=UPI003D77B20A